ncbi:MAG TPA: thymidine phosphorylase [Candidatus Cloacimonadota bacterium]|nr:thymidine phosphorylase [Candidatus Cloacimonadota bacterium]
MNPVEIILKKRNGEILSAAEISWLVNSYLKGSVTDYQMSAWLMAVYFQGLVSEEIQALTECYINSGKRIDFPAEIVTADKHSTGGVGDKISLMLAPIAAACGLYVPMISGRGLGHTGGTLDKLDSIPGFQTQLSLQRIKELTLQHGLSMVGQSEELVPADKKIYALRDVTATVESPGLITASIMSKKIAEGAKHLVIDLKVGSGAFMPTINRAKELAEALIKTGNAFGQKVTVVLTNMNAPLGTHIGNALEVIEALEYLKGNYLPDTQEITETLTSEMLLSAKLAANKEQALNMIRDAISTGKALHKFEEMIIAQGGEPEVCFDYGKFPAAKYKLPIFAQEDGYVQSIDSRSIGYALVGIKAGRMQVSDEIDYGAGAVLYPKVGTLINKNDEIGTLYTSDREAGEQAIRRILASYKLSPDPVTAEELILGKLTLQDFSA